MFGKGVYFADCFPKSFGYTDLGGYGGEMARNHACMFLAEVALGREQLRYQAEMGRCSPGYDSVKGCGRNTPSSEMRTTADGVTVPMGPLVKDDVHSHSLNFNEYIVYDSDRIRLRYMVLLRNNTWWKKFRAKVKVDRGLLQAVTDKDDEPLEGTSQFDYYPSNFKGL
eukprot:m.979 g.979  ORF g.979 m.979 type:complete len:168 (+) comp939_c0_seq1:122-625(+)